MKKVLLLDSIGPQALSVLTEAGIEFVDVQKGFGDDSSALRGFIQGSFGPGELSAICLRSGTKLQAGSMPTFRDLGVELITRFGSGTDNIDKVAASELGIVVENTPGQNANSVAELVIAFVLMLPRRIGFAIGQKIRSEFITKANCQGTEVAGTTIGVIGLGWIGALVAKKAQGLGMTVLGYDVDPSIEIEGVQRVELDVLLNTADSISVHVPLTPETKNLIGVDQIAAMKQRPFIINCARAGIVDLEAIHASVQTGSIAGFASDVDEPTHRAFSLTDTIVTPHIGAATGESEARCAVMGARQVVAWLQRGAIQHGVNLADDEIDGCRNGKLLVIHRNQSGVIESITHTVPGNIGVFSCKSHKDSGLACAMLGPDDPFDDGLVAQLSGLDNVIRVLSLSKN